MSGTSEFVKGSAMTGLATSATFRLTTCQGDRIEVHAAGCADIERKRRGGVFYNGVDEMSWPTGTTERDIWLDFNEDFLWEGGADNAWPLEFLPCAHRAGLVVESDRTWTETD